MTQIKTIDVQAKEWFDKVNGNYYFSARVIINYGMEEEQTICLPFQYGYEDHYRHMAFKELQELGIISMQENNISYWSYYADNSIIARHSKKENCKKGDVILFGKN